MKRSPSPVLVQLIIIMLLYANTSFTVAWAELISLHAEDFEHIQFKKIRASTYTFHDQLLQIDVDKSASFLMLPFAEVKKVNRVSFEWRSDGSPRVDSAYHEEQRTGDDAVFKLGLLLKSDDPSINPFLPSWMKRVEKLLKFPSENMINLVAAAKHESGEQWPNPYNKRVTTIAVGSVSSGQGWMKASYQFVQPVDVVGLWLMADGDNTSSSFSTYIKNINIE
jgi:hypothetical protein